MTPVRVVRPRVSYADLQQAPEDGRRYELYDGEVFVVPAPIPRHQRVSIARFKHASRRQGARSLGPSSSSQRACRLAITSP